jgi:hypothetical protein
MSGFWELALCSLVEVDRRFRDVVTSITLTMKEVSTSETSICFYKATWGNVSEGCHLRTRCRENLKSQFTEMYQLTKF